MSAVFVIILLAQLFNKKAGILKYIFIFISFTMIILLITINNSVITKLYPISINAALLFLFASSLKYPPSVVERIARITTPDLPEEAVVYCVKVTKVWSLFFIINAVISAVTVFMPVKIWVIYNGFISYMVIGAIFVVEYIVRINVREKL
jgi:uncharacterized membrane protein